MKDQRYDDVLSKLQAGDLKSFSAIFKLISIEFVADDLEIPASKLADIIADPGRIKVGNIIALSDAIGCTFSELSALIAEEIKQQIE